MVAGYLFVYLQQTYRLSKSGPVLPVCAIVGPCKGHHKASYSHHPIHLFYTFVLSRARYQRI